ncbi:MAG: GNAT family N-acetyltransferase, partial [Planctomycetales bacterium]|nr:GNAT family N-acetyltransferase [Planctomycetales bacterium]
PSASARSACRIALSPTRRVARGWSRRVYAPRLRDAAPTRASQLGHIGREGGVNYENHSASSLSDELRSAWSELRGGRAPFDSPLLCLANLELLEQVRGDIFVGVARENGRPVAMMPYCKVRSIAKPYAGPLCDLQVVLTARGVKVDGKQLLRGLGLSAAHFNAHLMRPDSPFTRHCVTRGVTPYIDISAGFEVYRDQRRKAGSDELKESMRKARKIQRDLGPLRFEPRDTDTQVLRQVLRWKSDQLRSRGAFNAFMVPWIRQVLERSIVSQHKEWKGMMCSLRVGDELIAGAVGIRNRHVFHGWVTAFNPSPLYRRYSPGIMLLAQLLQHCDALGIRRIDMGGGDEAFKSSFQSGGFAIGEGGLDLYPLRGALRRGLIGVRDWMGPGSLRTMVHGWVNRCRHATKSSGRST